MRQRASNHTHAHSVLAATYAIELRRVHATCASAATSAATAAKGSANIVALNGNLSATARLRLELP